MIPHWYLRTAYPKEYADARRGKPPPAIKHNDVLDLADWFLLAAVAAGAIARA